MPFRLYSNVYIGPPRRAARTRTITLSLIVALFPALERVVLGVKDGGTAKMIAAAGAFATARPGIEVGAAPLHWQDDIRLLAPFLAAIDGPIAAASSVFIGSETSRITVRRGNAKGSLRVVLVSSRLCLAREFLPLLRKHNPIEEVRLCLPEDSLSRRPRPSSMS